MSRLAKLVPVLAVLLAGGAGAVWYFTMRDTSSPTASLDALGRAPAGEGVPHAGTADGRWVLQPGGSVFAGYRMNEEMLPAHNVRTIDGRTRAVDGSLAVAGSRVTEVSVNADVAKLDSGEPLRETILKRVGLETDRFPRAAFVLTGPIELPTAPVINADLTLTARGMLTAHGVSHPIDVPLVARWDGSQISVATTGDGAPFKMADWNLTLPEVPVSHPDDHGTIELQLRFVRG